AGIKVHGVELVVEAPDQHPVAVDRGRGNETPTAVESPLYRARASVQAIETPVERSQQHAAIHEHRRGPRLIVRFEDEAGFLVDLATAGSQRCLELFGTYRFYALIDGDEERSGVLVERQPTDDASVQVHDGDFGFLV